MSLGHQENTRMQLMSLSHLSNIFDRMLIPDIKQSAFFGGIISLRNSSRLVWEERNLNCSHTAEGVSLLHKQKTIIISVQIVQKIIFYSPWPYTKNERLVRGQSLRCEECGEGWIHLIFWSATMGPIMRNQEVSKKAGWCKVSESPVQID